MNRFAERGIHAASLTASRAMLRRHECRAPVRSRFMVTMQARSERRLSMRNVPLTPSPDGGEISPMQDFAH